MYIGPALPAWIWARLPIFEVLKCTACYDICANCFCIDILSIGEPDYTHDFRRRTPLDPRYYWTHCWRTIGRGGIFKMTEYSPALSATSDLTDEELDKYFASYVPLSNLPTPPPAKEHAIPRSAPRTSTTETTYHTSQVNNSKLQG